MDPDLRFTHWADLFLRLKEDERRQAFAIQYDQSGMCFEEIWPKERFGPCYIGGFHVQLNPEWLQSRLRDDGTSLVFVTMNEAYT